MAVDAEEVALEVRRPVRELTLPGGNVRQLTVSPPRPSVNMYPQKGALARARSVHHLEPYGESKNPFYKCSQLWVFASVYLRWLYLSNTLFEYFPFPKSFCYASDVEYKIVPLGTSMHTDHVYMHSHLCANTAF